MAQLPDDDPITSKSYALHYLVATVLLMATLFWALWDEAYGQRPWKEYQEVFRSRYGAFLKTARSRSAQSEKEVESRQKWKRWRLSPDFGRTIPLGATFTPSCPMVCGGSKSSTKMACC